LFRLINSIIKIHLHTTNTIPEILIASLRSRIYLPSNLWPASRTFPTQLVITHHSLSPNSNSEYGVKG